MRSRAGLLLGGLFAVFAGCNGSPQGATVAGEAVFSQPLRDGNTFACATCHALSEPAVDKLLRPGHPIGDATRRQHWKNGRAATFLDAVNSCVTEWMVAPAWTATEPRFIDLRAFLDAQAKVDRAPDLSDTIVPPPAQPAGGDPARGRETFRSTCIVCHGPDGIGTDRGPKVAGSTRDAAYIASRIRTSGSTSSAVYSNLTGGVMPFWAQDRLSDGEVRDLVAFIQLPPPPPTADAGVDQAAVDGGGGDVSAGNDAAPSDAAARDTSEDTPAADGAPPSLCGKTSLRVGWKADLGINRGEGQVSGFVTMIDDCTLQLTDFSYDGNGIEVRVFGSKSSTFRPGFAIGPDLVGRVFTKATLTVTLPPGKRLEDLDWVAIWCIKAGANFGSGQFRAPP